MYRIFLFICMFHFVSGQSHLTLPHVPIKTDGDAVEAFEVPATPRYVDTDNVKGKTGKLLVKINELERALEDKVFDEDKVTHLFTTLYAFTRSMVSLSDVMHTRIQTAERLFDQKKKDAHKCSDCVLM